MLIYGGLLFVLFAVSLAWLTRRIGRVADCWSRGTTETTANPADTPDRMVEITDLVVDEQRMTLQYRVRNPFAHAIWICEDMNHHTEAQSVETRPTDEMLWIKLRFHVKSDSLLPWPIYARYRHLAPGQSCAGTIRQRVPIRDDSPLHRSHVIAGLLRKEQRPIHQVTLEVGYFDGFPEALQCCLHIGDDNEWLSRPAFGTSDPNVVFIDHLWPGLRGEKSAQGLRTDVRIPCVVLTQKIPP